jgi:hypothetical protein
LLAAYPASMIATVGFFAADWEKDPVKPLRKLVMSEV